MSKDATFCFYCFLFKELRRKEHSGFDALNQVGFNDWKHAYKSLLEHVCSMNSAHNNCVKHYDDLKIKGKVCQECSQGQQRILENYIKGI
jgi:tRNA U55 pseudouridine synthase TruB